MATIKMQTSITGFQDGFNDQQTAVTCDTLLQNKTTMTALASTHVGTLSTRTDDDTGVVTLGAGHTITTGMIVDIYWSGGVRYGVTVGTVSGQSVPFGAGGGEGAGDNLPVESTAVTVCQQNEINLNFDGDDMLFIAVVYRNASDSGAQAHVDFQDAGDASIQEIDLSVESSNAGLVRGTNVFNISAGDTNVFAGNRITHVAVSHDSTSVGYLYIYCGYNA